mmetsp:Transcript_42144/g.121742  ORF Transcript_42144/g.121742 Transcript_42144/m.121742 type:complete len:495 (-) Transcript_42144:69-1553(-)
MRWLLLSLALRHVSDALRLSVMQALPVPTKPRPVAQVSAARGSEAPVGTAEEGVYSPFGDRGANLTHQAERPFDIADFFATKVLGPADDFAMAVAKFCDFQPSERSSTELVVGDRCRTPELVEAAKKTLVAVRQLDQLRREWTGATGAEAVLSAAPSRPPVSVPARQSGELPQQEPGSGLLQAASAWLPPAASVPSRMGWKRALVSALLVNPEAREHWDHEGHERSQPLPSEDIAGLEDSASRLAEKMSVAKGDVLKARVALSLKLHVEVPGDTAETTKNNASAAQTLPTSGSDQPAKESVQFENTVDTTIAGTHLADVAGHLSMAHEVISDIGVPMEVKALTKVAQTIVTKEYKVVDIIPGTYTVTDELIKGGAPHSLNVVEDVFMIAMQSDTLARATQAVACYIVKRAGMVLKSSPDVARKIIGCADEAFQDMDETRLAMEIVKGSDAIVRLVNVWARFPAEIHAMLPTSIGMAGVQAASAVSNVFGTFLPH